MQLLRRGYVKVGLFFAVFGGVLFGAFALAPSVFASGEYYWYEAPNIKATGGVIVGVATLTPSGPDSFIGPVNVDGNVSRIRNGNGGTLSQPCPYTLEIEGVQGDLNLPGDTNGGHPAKVDISDTDGLGAGPAPGCKQGDIVIRLGAGDSIVINSFTQPDIVIMSKPKDAPATCTAPYVKTGDQCTAPVNPDGSCPNGGQKVTQNGTEVCTQAAISAEEEPDLCPVDKNTVLRWLACPVYDLMNLLTSGLDAFLEAYLSTGNDIFDQASPAYAGYQKAWSTFRSFGLGLLVIAGLVMVASEALGLAIFDAYTVRKVLPRLFIAVVGIAMSWELCKLIVGFFDDLGHAIGKIIYTSFNIPGAKVDIGALLFTNIATAGAAGFVAWTALGAGGLLSFLGTLLLAMLVGAAVLIVRQGIIIAAVIMAPLAIAAYILPNTSKLANFWWDTFIKMLMLYPIATGIIALCKSLGQITVTSNKFGASIVGLLFFFAGYALLPAAFRLTGGLVATLGGLANDRGRGAFDRLKNYRQGKVEHNTAAMKAGNRFSDRNPFTKKFNRATVGAATGFKGRFGMGVQGAEAVDQVRRNASADLKKTAGFAAIQNDDDALMAATYDSKALAQTNLTRRFRSELEEEVRTGKKTAAEADAAAESRANRAVRAADTGVGFGRVQAIAAAEQLVSTGTGYKNLKDMSTTLARASGGHEGTATSLAGFANSATKQVGRNDLAPGFGKLNDLVQGERTRDPSKVGKEQYIQAGVEAARGTDNATLIRNKTPGVKNHATALSEGLKLAQSKGQVKEAAEIAAKIQNLQESGMYGPETNVAAVHKLAAQPNQTAIEAIEQKVGKDRVTAGPDARDDAGNRIFDTRTGQAVKERVVGPNVNRDIDAEDAYAQRSRRGYDVNDPRNNP